LSHASIITYLKAFSMLKEDYLKYQLPVNSPEQS